MSTHVIKRRAITTRHIAFHQNCAVLGFFFYHGSGFASARYTGI